VAAYAYATAAKTANPAFSGFSAARGEKRMCAARPIVPLATPIPNWGTTKMSERRFLPALDAKNALLALLTVFFGLA
jgi:hypothetical protein